MRLDFPHPCSFFCCTGLHLWNRNTQGGWDWWPIKHWDSGKKIYRTVCQLYEVKQHNKLSGAEHNTAPDTKRKLCEKKSCVLLSQDSKWSLHLLPAWAVLCFWPSRPRRGSASAPKAGSLLEALTQLWQMQLSQKGTSPQPLHRCWLWGWPLQQLRRMDLSHPTQCPLCPVGIGMSTGDANRFPLEMPTDSNFFGWASNFPFPDHPASLILAEMCPGTCSEANEFYILTLQQYILFEGRHICNMDNILSLLFYKVLYSPVC